MKRRRQLEGWLGCLPNSDGKIYLSDTSKVAELTGIPLEGLDTAISAQPGTVNNAINEVLTDTLSTPITVFYFYNLKFSQNLSIAAILSPYTPLQWILILL